MRLPMCLTNFPVTFEISCRSVIERNPGTGLLISTVESSYVVSTQRHRGRDRIGKFDLRSVLYVAADFKRELGIYDFKEVHFIDAFRTGSDPGLKLFRDLTGGAR